LEVGISTRVCSFTSEEERKWTSTQKDERKREGEGEGRDKEPVAEPREKESAVPPVPATTSASGDPVTEEKDATGWRDATGERDRRRKTNVYGMWEDIRDVISDKQGVIHRE